MNLVGKSIKPITFRKRDHMLDIIEIFLLMSKASRSMVETGVI